MEKHQYELVLILLLVASLGLVSFISCIAAETKRTKEEQLKVVGRLCHLPESGAFRFGIAALICLFAAQMVGNLIICSYFCSREKKRKKSNTSSKAKGPTISMALLSISWISFVIAVTLLGTATSMSRDQPYGKGWLDGQCYLVKQGIYTASGVLVLITFGSTLGFIIVATMRNGQVDKGLEAKDPSKMNTKL